MAGKIIRACKDFFIQTNEGNCIVPEKRTKALLISGLNAYYPLDPEEFNEELYGTEANPELGYLYRSDYLRITPVTGASVTAQSGNDVATADTGAGITVPVGFNPFSQTYTILGGLCLMKQLRQLNGEQRRVMRIDTSNMIFGTEMERRSGNGFAGYRAFLMTSEVLPTGTAEVYSIQLNIYYSEDYDNERANAHAFELESVPEGFISVQLLPGTTAGTATVVESCSGKSVMDQYNSQWTAAMFENTEGVNPTSVAYSEENGLLTFTPTGSYRVNYADALIAGGIDGIEGNGTFTQLVS